MMGAWSRSWRLSQIVPLTFLTNGQLWIGLTLEGPSIVAANDGDGFILLGMLKQLQLRGLRVQREHCVAWVFNGKEIWSKTAKMRNSFFAKSVLFYPKLHSSGKSVVLHLLEGPDNWRIEREEEKNQHPVGIKPMASRVLLRRCVLYRWATTVATWVTVGGSRCLIHF